MGNVEKRFRELVDVHSEYSRPATIRDLANLAAIVDDELSKAGAPRDARKLAEDYGHTERRE